MRDRQERGRVVNAAQFNAALRALPRLDDPADDPPQAAPSDSAVRIRSFFETVVDELEDALDREEDTLVRRRAP